MAVGIGLLIAVIVVVVIVSGSKKPPREPEYAPTELTGDSVVDKGPPKPKKVERNPPPDISPEIIQRAKQIVVEMESDRAAGDACYEDAMRAKRSGDDDTWRAKLNEAADHFVNIRDKWNEEVIGDIEGELPMSCDWDAEEVANYHLGREGSKVTKALQTLASIKKQLGVR